MGGISTLEEKSLGCVQKDGRSTVVNVLDYGKILTVPGLHLLNGSGNDMVVVTNLTAPGAHMILFTTGRGTPLGSQIPTVKIFTTFILAKHKSRWIDFDARILVSGADPTETANTLFQCCMEIASGKKQKRTTPIPRNLYF